MAIKRKRRKKMGSVLLVDGDILAYQLVMSPDFLKEEHNSDDEYWETFQAADALDEFEARVNEWMKLVGAEFVLIVFGSKSNFRKRLIDPEYKSNRKAKRKPLGYYAFCGKVNERFDCATIDSLEADDVLGIYHTTPALVSGKKTVVVSIDKDMRTIPGTLMIPNEMVDIITIQPHEALCFWMRQILTGDTTDGYPGCPGIGLKKAERIVDERECADVFAETGDFEKAASEIFGRRVVPAFKSKGLTWTNALKQARLSRILRRGDCDLLAKTVKVKLWRPKGWSGARSLGARVKKRSRSTPKA